MPKRNASIMVDHGSWSHGHADVAGGRQYGCGFAPLQRVLRRNSTIVLAGSHSLESLLLLPSLTLYHTPSLTITITHHQLTNHGAAAVPTTSSAHPPKLPRRWQPCCTPCSPSLILHVGTAVPRLRSIYTESIEPIPPSAVGFIVATTLGEEWHQWRNIKWWR